MHHFAHYGYIVQKSVFESGSQSIWPHFLGGFAGAFFAFAFGLISYKLIKRYERFLRHRDALIKLERALNDVADDVEMNKFYAEDIAKVLGKGQLTYNRLISFELPPETSTEVASIELINHFYPYERMIFRVNTTMTSMNYVLTRFEDTIIAGNELDKTSPESVQNKFDDELPKTLDSLDSKNIDLLCRIRIYLKKLEWRNFFWFAITHSRWDIPITEDEILEEKKLLEAEFAENVAGKSGP